MVETRNFYFGKQIGHWGSKRSNVKLGQKGRDGVTWPNFWNFGTPSIYRERLKLETSNLACRLAIRGPKQKKCKIRSKGAVKWSSDLLLKFCDTLHILRTVEASSFKFGMQIGHRGLYRTNAKLVHKGLWRVTWPTFRILVPSISRERLMVETSNLAYLLATLVLTKKCKIRSKGVVETSNLAGRLDTRGTDEKMQN